MTREEALEWFKDRKKMNLDDKCQQAEDMAIKVLEQEPCEDCISREDALARLRADTSFICTGDKLQAIEIVNNMPPVTPQSKTGHCKDCKWWKDSDGSYRRGSGAESQCPINRREVFEGNGYCFMFEPQERSK